MTPVSSGGTVTSCTSNPTLPNGLSLSSACVITGTPTAGQAATAYTVTATNTGGSATATLRSRSPRSRPCLSYTGSPFTFNKAVTITPLTPTNTGGPITSCGASPVLPAGLSLSTQCGISGAATTLSPAASYTITATNSGGTNTTSISITVIDTPPVISYAGSPFTFYENVPASAQNVVNSGGTIASCSASPDASDGPHAFLRLRDRGHADGALGGLELHDHGHQHGRHRHGDGQYHGRAVAARRFPTSALRLRTR